MRTCLLLTLFCFLLSLCANAQSATSYNTLVYTIDTVGRTDRSPAHLIPTRLTIYQQGANVRIEYVRVPLSRTPLSSTEVDKYAEKTIVVGDSTDYFLFLDESRQASRNANLAIGDVAIFMSKSELASSMLNASPYKVQSVNGSKTLCNIQGKKVVITSTMQLGKEGRMQTAEAYVADELLTPIGVIFNEFRYVKGTPIAFKLDQSGWLIQASLTNCTTGPLKPELFQVPAHMQKMDVDAVLKEMKDSN